jgi:hypothetical protein
MYVNRIPFFATVSRRHIKFGPAKMLKSEMVATLLEAIKQVKKAYVTRGFIRTNLLAGGQFEPLRAGLDDLAIMMNCMSRDEHVPKIKRHIRMVKEHSTQYNFNMSPFPKLPAQIIIEMVYSSIFG